MSAETLRLETTTATGQNDARRFLGLRLLHGLSLKGTAEVLGLSRGVVAYYSKGQKKIPCAIFLIGKGWEVDHVPYSPLARAFTLISDTSRSSVGVGTPISRAMSSGTL